MIWFKKKDKTRASRGHGPNYYHVSIRLILVSQHHKNSFIFN